MRKHVKLIVLLSVVAMLVAALAVSTVAVEPENLGGHWVINAEKIDEILAGEAGEATTGWEVPFLQVSPVLDGTINKAEYMEFEMYEDYMSYMAIATGNTKEKFMEFYEMTKDGIFDAYWGWTVCICIWLWRSDASTASAARPRIWAAPPTCTPTICSRLVSLT